MKSDRCPVHACGRKAGLGTTHRGEGKCWKQDGLDAPLSRRPSAVTAEPAPAATHAVAFLRGTMGGRPVRLRMPAP
jgi:hypothetical protein